MKRIILMTMLILISFMSFGQLPYSWTAGTNPGWTSSNPTSNTLSYQSTLGYVSTSSLTDVYNNNQITTYTSQTINTSCNISSFVSVSFNLDVFLRDRSHSSTYFYDWLYFQYSLNNGITWINPVSQSTVFNNSGINLSAYLPLINWSNTNSNRNGWTNSLTSNFTYIIPQSTTTKFRFIFASDGSVNSSVGGLIYYADILSFSIACNPMLPIELISFDGYNKNNNNILTWSTASENNNDYFTVERSEDGVNWDVIDTVGGAGNSQSNINYSLVDNNYREVINYYRLKQVDFDGQYELFEKIVAIDNRTEIKKVVRITNLLGQDVDEYYKGVVIEIYEDNTVSTKLR